MFQNDMDKAVTERDVIIDVLTTLRLRAHHDIADQIIYALHDAGYQITRRRRTPISDRPNRD